MPKSADSSIRPAALTMDQAARALSCKTVIAYRLASEGLLKTFVIHDERYATPRAVEQCAAECERRGTVLQASAIEISDPASSLPASGGMRPRRTRRAA